MATKKPTKKRSAPSTSASSTKITRIKATDNADKKTKKTASTTVESPANVTSVKPSKADKIAKVKKPKKNNAWRRSLGYFTGAWYELKQVHWPDRKNSWSMTIALIVFSLIFVGIILLLDALFQYLFSLAIGK